jgi:tetratricopeptide (TPR) repeat protein
VRELYEAKQYREVLGLLDELGARSPLDAVLRGYGAHCWLALGEIQRARQDYTQALRTLPTVAGYLIGRARCEIALGSLRGAEADLSLARRVDSKVAAPNLAEAERLLAGAKVNAPQAAEPEADVRDEQYTRERCRLELELRSASSDTDKVERMVDLARFLLEPTAVCEVRLRGADTRARVPCGLPDLARAEEALRLAQNLAPDHPGLLTQGALLELARDRQNHMIAWIDRAHAAGVVDLDLAFAHLQYCNTTANALAADASSTRKRRRSARKRRSRSRTSWSGRRGVANRNRGRLTCWPRRSFTSGRETCSMRSPRRRLRWRPTPTACARSASLSARARRAG